MIALTGGGTGGHLAIARALKEVFIERGIPLLYIGSTSGQDRSWFGNDEGFEKRYFLPSGGVVDKRGLRRIKALTHIFDLSLHARTILKKHDVKGVVSVGGYSAAPASLAALTLNIPLFIHEQNAHTGSLNKLLRPFSKRFFCSFMPPYDPYPVAEEFYRKRRIRKRIETIIFLGGSQGARQINDLAISLAPKLKDQGIHILHQCGSKDFTRVKKAYEELGVEADLFDFSNEIATKMSQADLAISRAGASTLWELCANALPSLLLPYPYAAADHQRHNALFFVEKGGALLYDPSIDPLKLDIEKMSQNLHSLYRHEGARRIVEEILELI